MTAVNSLPSGPRMPRALQTIGFLMRQRPWLERQRRRHGDVFTVGVLGLERLVVVADPALVRQVFTADPTVIHAGTGSPLGPVLGPNSLLTIDEDRHLEQRKLLLPPFHGRRMQAYEPLIAGIAAAEIDRWPHDTEFETLPSFMRITLRAILRAVFGAEGEDLQALEALLPGLVELGSRIATAPPIYRRDLGPRSPGGRFRRGRAELDRLLDEMIAAARADSELEQRIDVLALLVRARHSDGAPMDDAEIRDELFTLLAAGHETTANTLGWAVERLSRHPEETARLIAEADAGGAELRRSAIREIQRVRPVISFAGRYVISDYEIAGHTLAPGTHILLAASLTHYDPRLFPEPDRLRIDRFVEQTPETYAWIPFGGGVRRCIGAAFAHMELDVVLRVLLERVELVPTTAADEGWRFRGIAHGPAAGARARVRVRGAAELPTPAAPPPTVAATAG